MAKLFYRDHQPADKGAAHALLDAARDGAEIPQVDIEAALVLTGDMAVAPGTGIWAGLAQGVAA